MSVLDQKQVIFYLQHILLSIIHAIFPQMLTWCESVELCMFSVDMLKDDAVKGLHSIRQQIWKTQQWP